MDYEEKYKDLVKRLNKAREEKGVYTFNSVLDVVAPELKIDESEDERIRKEIIAFLTYYHTGQGNSVKYDDDWIAWLEKQGEQKLNANCLLSWSEIDEKMLQSLEGIVKDYWAKAEQEKNEIKIREASNVSYFLKTIQKSPLCWIKCSDGLPNRDGTYLVVTDGRHNDVYDMARYDSIEGWHKASEIIYWMPIPQLNNKSIIEQKPAWSEEDDMVLNSILDSIQREGVLEKKRKTDWLKSLKDRYTWKPSDEQMKILDDVIRNAHLSNANEAGLIGLYNDLKKLTE